MYFSSNLRAYVVNKVDNRNWIHSLAIASHIFRLRMNLVYIVTICLFMIVEHNICDANYSRYASFSLYVYSFEFVEVKIP